MMSVLQNAFANSSSSLIQSKITGNLVFMLLPPLSYRDIFGAYVLASVVRLAVGAGVFVVTIWFIPMHFAAPLFIIAFALLGSAILGTLGLIAGIWAEKFDQLAAFQNFLIMPLTFLSGVFYSTHSLPPVARDLASQPVFYMIDGFRFGFFGASDINPFASLAIVTGFSCCCADRDAAARDRLQTASLISTGSGRHPGGARRLYTMLPTPEQVSNTSPAVSPARIWKSKATASISSRRSCRRPSKASGRSSGTSSSMRRSAIA